ncbi:MAG TPA: glycosyltransferase [Terracidiphilus sp.]|jgi:glycosyltransferase involved in cell wall biosynthesis
MVAQTPRVVLFPDSFHEVNGVAHTSRHFEAFAQRRNLPFLCVRAGNRAIPIEESENAWSLELPRGFFSISLERDLSFDPAYVRHLPLITRTVKRFNPTLVHITGPSEFGLLGAMMAHRFGLPLAASWHTNVHEYAARRFTGMLRRLPQTQTLPVGRGIENCAFSIATRFYSLANILFAPNPALCSMLETATGRPCQLMPRGVDSQLFHPWRRTRRANDGEFVLGYVGRLSVEKNVALLGKVHRELEEAGHRRFKFLIVGHGAEEGWLRRNLQRAEFAGVLHGEALAKTYANMDLFVFPSHTDTFGNVVLEALASGVPVIVTPDGGPAGIVREGVTGRIAADTEFAQVIGELIRRPGMLSDMRRAARDYALTASWDAVFDGVYDGYRSMLKTSSQESGLLRA